ncbi:TIR domain-containing protein [Paremcibacter congregatus]|uniref:Thoeris protein ThsB TIR-like domain-containing protein n=1 Tax=Paremcibacter congregatus TaxID=2043170 RepID=A0A2G4YQT6_9PROT|nr:TIR domain-containing protein [Paremcibacter congregatus]PHZ84657.1 hypothetical protein CRD36_10220 [Paremcibacter congregatus]
MLIAYTAFLGMIGLGGFIYINGRPRKIFVSYYSKGNSHFKNLIMAWGKTNRLNIEDVSTGIKIKSKDEYYLKKRIREQINKADYFVVFIGENTHTRQWVNWEIEQAKNLKKKIVAVKEKKTHKSPQPLLGCGAIWIYGFCEEEIKNALNA